MIIICITEPIVSNSIQWKELLPLLSPIVVIILFIVDRVIGFYLRRREVERNWYLKVLIEPGIDKISRFYKTTLDNYKTSSELLEKNRAKPHNDYISLKSSEFSKLQSLKRELEAEVIYPIQVKYPKVGEKIIEQLQNLEDKYTISLDNELFKEDDFKQFHIFVAENRAILLAHLYSPLSSRFWFFQKNK